ncbi:hypothetical protein HBI56_171150 [Parastagonospora nodorum]|nr:hypothetical protein HBH98_154620 [Parastagonospora nodorum]KAH4370693.1 hypothetical protein HBH97_140550 [Parastagonospora nodorum]KAH4391374.1 hypothetical protein HBH99_150600 [Parastagonospora nodorum]KAH5094567.1 hypothetical protein HBH72_162360 [Parastagonospora nodorum]KAH5177762.1 hypothetical protein HBH77_196060 [Parastagonospora nodorum]
MNYETLRESSCWRLLGEVLVSVGGSKLDSRCVARSGHKAGGARAAFGSKWMVSLSPGFSFALTWASSSLFPLESRYLRSQRTAGMLQRGLSCLTFKLL